MGVWRRGVGLAARWVPPSAAALLTIWSVQEFLFDVSLAVGPSMQPVVKPKGEMLLFEKWSKWCRPRGSRRYSRGDVVICSPPSFPELLICKRIVALGGDLLSVSLKQRQTVSSSCSEGGSGETRSDDAGQQQNAVDNKEVFITIPSGRLWVEGDNPSVSYDSRDFGSISADSVLGRVVFRVWPPWRLGKIHKAFVNPTAARTAVTCHWTAAQLLARRSYSPPSSSSSVTI